MLLQLGIALETELGRKAHDRRPARADMIGELRHGAKGKQRGLGKHGLGDAPIRRGEGGADRGDEVQCRRSRCGSVHIVTISEIVRTMCYIRVLNCWIDEVSRG